MAKFYIVEKDNKLSMPINEKGQPDRYSKPKYFDSVADAQKWISRHTYGGMSMSYEVKEAQPQDIYYWSTERR